MTGTQAFVVFSGLFAVVRHTDKPEKGYAVPPGEEPMTIVFPVDHGMDGMHVPHVHTPVLHVPKAAAMGPGAQPLSNLPTAHAATPAGYLSFDFADWVVRLPATDQARQPVKRHNDEQFGSSEPTAATSCPVVYEVPDKWKSLSRLPILEHLTDGKFDVDLRKNDPRLHAIVELSGGDLECLFSLKGVAKRVLRILH